MKSSLFLALGAAAFTLVAACGGDFSGVVEGEDAGVTGRDASPVTTDAGGTVDSGATPPPDAGPKDAGPKDAGPVVVDAGPAPSYKWACSSNVSYYGNGATGQAYGTEVGCNTGKATYCDVAQEATACDPNVDRGNRHYLCSDCVRSNQQNGGWFVPAQTCTCQFY